MSKLKIYEYGNCSTCKKALKYLDGKRVDYQKLPIAERPPSKAELKKMLGYLDGNIKKLFNTSGLLYRELNIKERLPQMTEAQAIELLSKNGKLVKRPFVLGQNRGTVGFKEAEFKKLI